jgi:catechol 2,3-dioxygenase-like lactoylglutathione lyase family enzyme
MNLEIRRVIIFTENMAEMAAFYGDVLGLKAVTNDADWKDFAAGACNLALHRGRSRVGVKPPKIAFHASDVTAVRARLVKRGAKMGNIQSGSRIDFCDGKDPDGNAFTISSRR